MDRATNERLSYDDGEVFRNNRRFQNRFWHVNECRNSIRCGAYLDAWTAKTIPGRDVLDYGCAVGAETAKYALLRPLTLTGIDISPALIERAKNENINARFLVMDAQRTTFNDSSFDTIIGRAILHHLDWEVAIREIHRLLKPGGHAIFSEPLRDNPVGKAIRALTPSARTKDELPISGKQIDFADSMFSESHHHFSGLASTGLGMATSLFMRSPDNVLLNLADRADTLIAKTGMRYWMRRAILVWRK